MLEKLDIYVSKRELKKTLFLYCISLMFWLGLIAFILSPPNISFQPDANPVLGIIIMGSGGIVFLSVLFTILRAIVLSVSELQETSKLVYSFNPKGFYDYRTKKKYEWSDFKSFSMFAKRDGILASGVDRWSFASIEKRGIINEDFNSLRLFILNHAPVDLTRRIKTA